MLPDISNTDHLFITQDVDAFEDHAEDLMDDLFGDVEHILSVNSSQTTKLSAKPTANLARAAKSTNIQTFKSEVQEQTSTNSVSLTKIDLPAVRMPSISRQDILWIEPYINHSAEIPASNTQVLEATARQSSSNFLDKFLFGTACISVVLTAALWLVNHGLLLDNTMRKTGSLPTSTPQVSSETAKFAEEVRTALVSVNTKSVANPTPSQPVPSPNNMATVPMLNNGQVPMIMNPLVAANGQNGQTVYIPVYQPSGLTNTGQNTVTTVPSVSSPKTTNSLPTTNNIAAASPVHTLVGVLELGDRSSALLDVEGSVQSIRTGMPISNSGWILSRVGQQEIIIKRGSEVRSVFVGQRF